MKRFEGDRQSLFADYCESGEDWGVVMVFEQRRQRSQKASKSVWRYKTKKDLFDVYGDWTVVQRIVDAKTKAGLYVKNPDIDDPEWNLFFCRDVLEMSQIDESELTSEITLQSQVDKSAVGTLLGSDRFKDGAVPNSGSTALPTKNWNFVAPGSLQGGVSYDAMRPPMPCFSGAAPPAPASASGPEQGQAAVSIAPATAGPTGVSQLVTQLPQAMQDILALHAGTGHVTPPILGIGDAASSLKRRGKPLDGAPPAVVAKSKAGTVPRKAVPKAAKDPADRGMAIQREAVTKKQECQSHAKTSMGIRGQESLATLLTSAGQEWDALYTQCQKLLDEGCNTEDQWKDVFSTSESLLVSTKRTIDISKSTTAAISRLAKKEQQKKDAK
jgi:hypothetical protein